jgi:hypothetical protein
VRKQHVWPKDHWNWPIKVTHKHGVRCGGMLWVGGQVDLTSTGEVRSRSMPSPWPNRTPDEEFAMEEGREFTPRGAPRSISVRSF